MASTVLQSHSWPISDPFEVACQVVIKKIGHDWPRLYRALPFSPGRGQNTTDQDITEMTMLEQRIGPKEVATKCLHRWRRSAGLTRV